MSDPSRVSPLFGPERKPWEDPADARLAPSSYAAGAVFGIVEMAVKELTKRGLPLTPANVGAYSKTFARIVIKAQLELGEGGGWNSMLNTRLRGALYTALDVTQADLYDHVEWEEELQRLTIAIAKAAAWLYTKSPRELGALG